MRFHLRQLSCLIAILPFAALAASPVVGTGGDFSVLAGSAVTCKNTPISGNVGVLAPNPGLVSNCVIDGAIHKGDAMAKSAYAAFLTAYKAAEATRCDQTLSGSLGGVTLAPGVYCFDAATTTTDGTLTLKGQGTWLFKVGTRGTGALTGTNFTVATAGGAQACNVTWQVAQAVTMTTSDFAGTVLAGADVTVTGGTFNGDIYAGGAGSTQLPLGAITLTDGKLTGCTGTPTGSGGNPKGNHGHGHEGHDGHHEGHDGDDDRDGNEGHTGHVDRDSGRKGGDRK